MDRVLKKPSNYYRQSGAIPFRKSGRKIEILLITTTKKKRWIVPKGIVEKDLSPGKSAAKEAFEEAGVVGKVSGRLIGRYKYQKWGGVCKVNLYALLVEKTLRTWDESHFRKRRWFTIDRASKIVNEPEVSRVILKIPRVIKEQF